MKLIHANRHQRTQLALYDVQQPKRNFETSIFIDILLSIGQYTHTAALRCCRWLGSASVTSGTMRSDSIMHDVVATLTELERAAHRT